MPNLFQTVVLACSLLLPSVARADTFVVINTNDSGAGSLRQAMLDAESNPGFDEITFDIPGPGPHTIDLLSTLPICMQAVSIDGRSEPGYVAGTPVIEINGSAVPETEEGCFVFHEGAWVTGIIINRYPGHGVVLYGNYNVVMGCWIGVNATGTGPASNGTGSRGIYAFGAGNQIGGSELHDRNVICGGEVGIRLESADAWGAIYGNWIGVLPDASVADHGPQFTGIQLINGSSGNSIGGANPGEGNVISGCNLAAVLVSSNTNEPPCQSNTIRGNIFGIDPTGMAAIPNNTGIHLSNSRYNIVGGDGPSDRNCFGATPVGGAGLVLVGDGTYENYIANNYFGTDVTGNAAIGAYLGIDIYTGAHDNWIWDNIISGHQYGVLLSAGAYSNSFENNLIGVAADGETPLGNTMPGIVTTDAETTANVVGSPQPSRQNVIAHNGAGVFLSPLDSKNIVMGNSIHSNLGLGIDRSDLVTSGVTLNDVNDADGVQNSPVITSTVSDGTSVTVTGTVNSRPDTNLRLEFFANAVADPSGSGEGERWLIPGYDMDFYSIHTWVLTDGSGNAGFSVELPEPGVARSASIAATATSEELGTSEFSYTVFAPVSLSGFIVE